MPCHRDLGRGCGSASRSACSPEVGHWPRVDPGLVFGVGAPRSCA